ncbi:MAG: beta-glucosidase [Bacteroidales bacterium]|nr:MAG: beta-glucosidase [Bacteroidales bacterium]
MRKLYYLICFLIFIALSITIVQAQSHVYLNPTLPIEQRIENLLSIMTLEEKIAQMDLWAMWDVEKPEVSEEIEKYGLGGILGEITAEKNNQLQALAYKQRLKIPILFQIDACHGNGMQEGATIYPTSISMAASFNRDLAFKTARMAGIEVRDWGQRATYTPTIDVVQDPRFGRSGETFGECPFLSSLMSDAYTRGYQENVGKTGVACCPKHLVGGGVSIGGVNHASAEISERTLRQVFLSPFKAAVDAGALMIMTGHNDINGVPAHANYEIMTKILKNEWGFKGFIVSDMQDVKNLDGLHKIAATHEEALAVGINAGVDMYMNSEKLDDFFRPMIELVKQGKIPMSRIDDAVRRILRVKFMVGLFESSQVDLSKNAKAFGSDKAKEIALQGARECLTLLKNNDQILPISKQKYQRILVTGPNADNQNIIGDWAIEQPQVITILKGIETIAGNDFTIDYFNCGVVRGKAIKVTQEMAETADPRILEQKLKKENAEVNDWSITEAVKRAKNNDLVVVVVGGQAIRTNWGLRTYGESCDMPSIGLYGKQLELVQALYSTGKPVVVVVVSGKVVSEPWINEKIPALLYAWEPGQYGGQAVAEVLFGKINPSGKLPFTIPKTIGHIPQYYYQRASRYWTGYAYAGAKDSDQPAFPFGFGLSYTTYQYSDLSVPAEISANDKEIPITVKVKNTGSMSGNEAVLLFVKDIVASVSPYVKMLKGFEKVHLEVGESKIITFKLPVKELGFWNVDMKYIIEPGEFVIMIGNLSTSFTIEN